MNKRHVVGRRIVDVIQMPVTDTTGRRAMHVEWLVLDNGDLVSPSVAELEHDYAVEMTVYRNGEKR